VADDPVLTPEQTEEVLNRIHGALSDIQHKRLRGLFVDSIIWVINMWGLEAIAETPSYPRCGFGATFLGLANYTNMRRLAREDDDDLEQGIPEDEIQTSVSYQ
jgi:hypothetical protein